jgi:hypothetical protein
MLFKLKLGQYTVQALRLDFQTAHFAAMAKTVRPGEKDYRPAPPGPNPSPEPSKAKAIAWSNKITITITP